MRTKAKLDLKDLNDLNQIQLSVYNFFCFFVEHATLDKLMTKSGYLLNKISK
jgi:hypothetical protein